MADADGVSYSNRELFDKLDHRLTEHADQIEDSFKTQAGEVKEIRHRVANLEFMDQLQGALNDRTKESLDTFERRMGEIEHRHEVAFNTFRAELKPVFEYVSNQKSVDTYRKWLVGLGFAFGSLLIAFVALWR